MSVWDEGLCVACVIDIGRAPQLPGISERAVVCLTTLALARTREELQVCPKHGEALREISRELNEVIILDGSKRTS